MDWIYWYGDGWTVDERPLLSIRENSFWMGNAVFDGARAYDGCAPDIREHCARLSRSAKIMLMQPTLSTSDLTAICVEGIRAFDPGTHLYVRPMYFARSGFIVPDSTSTCCAIAIHRAPMPPLDGFSATVSPFRRPHPDTAPTLAKASCLYPMTQRILHAAAVKGFDTALVCGPTGHVAEFATANIILAKNGVLHTPREDGSYLAGITRRRVMGLLMENGYNVIERDISVNDVRQADEVFSVGNYGKVLSLRKLDDVSFPVGFFTRKAASLYADFARSQPV